MNKAILGLGTNLGEREKNLEKSLGLINKEAGRILKVSSVYETQPWGFESGDYFLNMVAEVETGLNPSGLLGRILMIEALMGRLREGRGYSSRIIDIDILFFGDSILNEGELVVPHPKLHLRRFVLQPLTEIDPDFIHPVLKKKIRELHNECQDDAIVKVYSAKITLP